MDDVPSVFKCDRKTIILKTASAELDVVFNDGIKTFAGSLWLDKKDEIGEENGSKKILTLIVQLAHTQRLNTEQKNAVALQKFLSRRRRKERDYACTQKKRFQQRNPPWTRKISKEYWPRRKKPCR